MFKMVTIIVSTIIFMTAATIIQGFAKDDRATVDDIVIVMMVAAAIFTGMIISLRRLQDQAMQAQLEAETDPRERLLKRVDAINNAFADAANLMDELQRARDDLLEEAEEHRELLATNPEHAESVMRLLARNEKAAIRVNRRDQWLFFALGVGASIPIGVLINLLVP
ncbi:hypothetical protein GCM10022226_78450 [Sphaerisporangium flaviroseum]|uniref:SLATT domain-containing protein n=1 Tax=Sphaerisporangium flaviroseum TaxID=509199 RepID=A0ABP7JF98_9ACTN